jgi:hypothetical protein
MQTVTGQYSMLQFTRPYGVTCQKRAPWERRSERMFVTFGADNARSADGFFVANGCCTHNSCCFPSQPLGFRNDHRLLHPLWRALSKKLVISPQNHDVDLEEPDPWWPEVLSPSCAARCVLGNVTAWSRFRSRTRLRHYERDPVNCVAISEVYGKSEGKIF